MIWRARQFEWRFPAPPLVMGVVNVTPDSFSDGGQFLKPEEAVAQALRLVEEGADILDIGGESTRPQAAPVSEEEELRRVLPVIQRLVRSTAVPLSVDTQKPGVARAALEAGASIVNDIAANQHSNEMAAVVSSFQAGYIAMHMQGTPQTMQVDPNYEDVVQCVNEFFSQCLKKLVASGVSEEHIVLDVGFGFGKSVAHNLQLLANLNRFTAWERPLVVGVSRKSFLGKVTGAEIAERQPAGLACACWSVLQGAQVVRTHDVGATRQALRMMSAILENTEKFERPNIE